MPENSKDLAIVLSEGAYDKAMMALILGTTAAAMGKKARIFFTFWGLNVLKKGAKPKLKGFMTLFTGMMEKQMKKKKIPVFKELLEQCRELSVELYACSTTMELMDIKKEDLLNGVEVLGAASFLKFADTSSVIFIG